MRGIYLQLSGDVISYEAREIAALMSFVLPHPYSTPILGVFPLHQTAPVGVSESRDPKLFGRAIIFEVFSTCVKITQTDRRHAVSQPRFAWHCRGNKRYISAYTLYFLETTLTGLHFAADNISQSLLKFFWWALEFLFTSARGHFGRSRSSKVDKFGANRKRICDSYQSVIWPT